MKNIIFLFSILLIAQAIPVLAASAVSHPAISRADESLPTKERSYLLDPIEITPLTGGLVIENKVGFEVGVAAAYPLLTQAPLFAEGAFKAGFFSGKNIYSFEVGSRYDIQIEGTKIRPFALAAIGPTFQTAGATAVFNMHAGGGVFFPVSSSLELRAEASVINIDGNAGFQILGGLSI